MASDPGTPAAEPPGWYGKLPGLGDFASRRLPPEFVEPWDDWLAHGMADWRAADSQAWREAYLAGAGRRFVLLPGVLPGPAGRGAWAGVLVPSLDRVGRCFPLTLVQPLAPLPADGIDTERLLRWLQRLDDVAADAVHDGGGIDALEAALAATGGWPPSAPPAEGADALIAGIDLHAHAAGRSLWLGPDGDGRTRLHAQDGLPAGAAFRALLGGPPAAAPTVSDPSPSTHFPELP